MSEDRTPTVVLVVDDDEVDRAAVRRALGSFFEVREAADTRAAAQLIESQPIDCVLLDFDIPGCDTREFLASLLPRYAVVMLTGQEDLSVATELLKAGARDYLEKGKFTDERLRHAVISAFRKFRREERMRQARQDLLSGYRAERARREHLESALFAARDIQQHLVPDAPPAAMGLDIAGVYLPAEETGGDFFTYVHFPDGSLGIALGDVCDHGIGPALLAAELRAYIRALSRTETDIASLVEIVNQLFCEDCLSGKFATLALAKIAPDGKSLLHLGAGQESYLLRAGGESEVLESGGTPLGLLEQLRIEPQPVSFARGDILIFTSDGLFDAAGATHGSVGREASLAWLAQHRGESAEMLLERLLARAYELAGQSQLPDDVSVVVVKAVAAIGY